MAYGEFYVERQGWARFPKVLIMCRKHGQGIERRRYVPEKTSNESEAEHTCNDVNVGGKFVCSGCSACVNLFDIGKSYVDEYGKRWYGTSREHGFKYCPNCGARVVEP